MDEIKANEVGVLLRGRMGLIVGPSITKYSGCMDEVNQKIADLGGVTRGSTYITTGDALSEKGVSETDIRGWLRDAVGGQMKSSLMGHIMKNRWCAVLSAALDSHFEDGFRQEADKHATWQTVTVLGDLLTCGSRKPRRPAGSTQKGPLSASPIKRVTITFTAWKERRTFSAANSPTLTSHEHEQVCHNGIFGMDSGDTADFLVKGNTLLPDPNVTKIEP
jgi:hypothetical protein